LIESSKTVFRAEELLAMPMALSGTEAILQQIAQRPADHNLPPIDVFRRAHGGVVHSVWALSSGTETFYLKIRGTRFALVPELESNPADIGYEHTAVTMLSDRMPGRFPRAVYFDSDLSFLVMTDVVRSGQKLEAAFLDGIVTTSVLGCLGSVLRDVHETFRACSAPRRPNDEAFYRKKLQDRFGQRNDRVLADVVERMARTLDRQVIIGDATPKNISIAPSGKDFSFFDLEDVHHGNREFEVGFLAGHLILHSYEDANKASEHVASFLEGYGDSTLESGILKAVALGAVLYRLDSPIPYSVSPASETRRALISGIEHCLEDAYTKQVPWQTLIAGILG